MLQTLIDAAIATLLVVGAVFAFIGSYGLAKLGDFYKRLHGPTKATTLGVGSVLIASSLYFSLRLGAFSAHEFLITLFLFLTAPVSAHMLVQAVLQGERDPRQLPPPAPNSDSRSN
jgi:multicomponent K+:H+ antiporter subunit G